MATTTTDILSETTISLSQAAGRLPGARANDRTHPSTVLRWVLRGTRTADGRVVRLEAVRLGNRWVTSAEAVARYVRSLTEASAPTDRPIHPPTISNRRKAAAATEKRLSALLA